MRINWSAKLIRFLEFCIPSAKENVPFFEVFECLGITVGKAVESGGIECVETCIFGKLVLDIQLKLLLKNNKKVVFVVVSNNVFVAYRCIYAIVKMLKHMLK